MKKKLIIVVSFLVVIAGAIYYFLAWHQTYHVQAFSLNDYSLFIKDDLDMNIGEISNEKEAVQKAKKVFKEIYGLKCSIGHSPYEIYFDEEQDTWLIYGTLHGSSLTMGGEPAIIIQNDGTVLSYWHGL